MGAGLARKFDTVRFSSFTTSRKLYIASLWISNLLEKKNREGCEEKVKKKKFLVLNGKCRYVNVI